MPTSQAPTMDYRKALLSTDESQAADAKKIEDIQAAKAAELEEKNILHKLPYEVRMMIWRPLLHREATFLPSYRRWETWSEYKVGNRWFPSAGRDGRRFAYHWHEHHGNGFIEGRGDYGDLDRPLTIMKITEPTYTQSQLIDSGEYNLPLTLRTNSGTQTGCKVVFRGEDGEAGAQVVNLIKDSMPAMEGVALLRVCKTINAECASILYGENKFAFETFGWQPNGRLTHAHDELQHVPHWIPGYTRHRRPQSKVQLAKALEMMFVLNGFRPKFVARDPMLSFFNRLGSTNTAWITKIQLDGKWKIAVKKQDEAGQFDVSGMGFSRILPILTTVLKNTCPGLRQLTLQFEDYMDNEGTVWDDDMMNKAGKSDQQRIDEAVRKVVHGLPGLEALYLGDQRLFQSNYLGEDFEDSWGISAQWMKIVAKRADDRAKEEAAKKLSNIST